MNRAYINCHMTVSLDGKVTGEFLNRDEAGAAIAYYYELHRQYRAQGYRGFICGRVTMESSFTGGWYPELEAYPAVTDGADWVPAGMDGAFFAVAIDPKGRLGWQTAKISDPDPGYDDVQVVEVVTHRADPRYLGYLQAMGIPYLFAGADGVDVEIALEKLRRLLGADRLLLEGGSVVNGSFLAADCVDELSLVTAPLAAGDTGKPLFDRGSAATFRLVEVTRPAEDVVWTACVRWDT